MGKLEMVFLCLDFLVVGFIIGAVFQHYRWIKELKKAGKL